MVLYGGMQLSGQSCTKFWIDLTVTVKASKPYWSSGVNVKKTLILAASWKCQSWQWLVVHWGVLEMSPSWQRFVLDVKGRAVFHVSVSAWKLSPERCWGALCPNALCRHWSRGSNSEWRDTTCIPSFCITSYGSYKTGSPLAKRRSVSLQKLVGLSDIISDGKSNTAHQSMAVRAAFLADLSGNVEN